MKFFKIYFKFIFKLKNIEKYIYYTTKYRVIFKVSQKLVVVERENNITISIYQSTFLLDIINVLIS